VPLNGEHKTMSEAVSPKTKHKAKNYNMNQIKTVEPSTNLEKNTEYCGLYLT
jgi:hypothetical protein